MSKVVTTSLAMALPAESARVEAKASRFFADLVVARLGGNGPQRIGVNVLQAGFLLALMARPRWRKSW